MNSVGVDVTWSLTMSGVVAILGLFTMGYMFWNRMYLEAKSDMHSSEWLLTAVIPPLASFLLAMLCFFTEIIVAHSALPMGMYFVFIVLSGMMLWIGMDIAYKSIYLKRIHLREAALFDYFK